jgi:hypothetical protein
MEPPLLQGGFFFTVSAPSGRTRNIGKIAKVLIPLNIFLFGVAVVTLAMMVLWSRATRGRWPTRRRFMVLSGICLVIWMTGNVFFLYFHFRAH